jgi:hypothetical protein
VLELLDFIKPVLKVALIGAHLNDVVGKDAHFAKAFLYILLQTV